MKELMTEWRNFVKVQKVNEKVYKQYASRLSEELQEVFWNLSEDQKVFVVEDWISQGRPADHLMEDKRPSRENSKTSSWIISPTKARSYHLMVSLIK